MPVRICPQCNTEFFARTNGVTCSKECARSRHKSQNNKLRRDQYASDEEFRAKRCAASANTRREKANDPDHREKERARSIRRSREKRSDPVYKAQEMVRTAEYLRKRRVTEPSFRERENAARAANYRKSRDESARQFLAMLNRGELATMGDSCFVYLFYDGSGSLLYVGITDDPKYRLYQHARDKSWFANISAIKIAAFRSGTEAIAAEAFLIKALRPLHNIQHNGSHFAQVDPAALSDLLARFVSVDTLLEVA